VAIRCQVDTQVVPATPTDDALANSDRTVGVLPYLDHVSKLKREALLFDQIGIPHRLNPDGNRDELDRLRDIGIVLDNTASRFLPLKTPRLSVSFWLRSDASS
jgi:hypothetical protein